MSPRPDPLDVFAAVGFGLLAAVLALAIGAAATAPFVIPVVRFP